MVQHAWALQSMKALRGSQTECCCWAKMYYKSSKLSHVALALPAILQGVGLLNAVIALSIILMIMILIYA